MYAEVLGYHEKAGGPFQCGSFQLSGQFDGMDLG